MPKALRLACVASLGAHLALALLFWGANILSASLTPPPQHVLSTKLVRLGKERDKALLPRLPQAAAQKSAKPSPPTPPKTKAVPSSKAASQQAVSQQTSRALGRLREQLSGQKEGSVAGETDEPQLGDAYIAEIRQCLVSHYVIEGSNKAELSGLSAVVLLRIQADGRIIDHRVLQSAHVTAFDQAVGRAVRSCGQISPPPVALRRRLRQEGIEIEFQP